MKKIILALLVGGLLILPMTGCELLSSIIPDVTDEATTPEDTSTTAPSDNGDDVTTPGNTDNTDGTTPADNSNPTVPSNVINNNSTLPEGELDKNHPLIVAIREYIDDRYVSHTFFPYPFATKIDLVKSGKRQALQVAFDADDHYFVCGYYSSAHEFESSGNCCIEEYTWKQYEDESEIQEYYKDMKCMLAFQINRALTVTDIMSDETDVPDMQHFQIYEPTFENGVNVGVPLTFDETFVYLNKSKDDTIYYRTTVYNHTNQTIPCIQLEGEDYILLPLATIDADESFNIEEILSDDVVIWELGDYYYTVISVMDTEKYRVVSKSGRTNVYGVITFDDFKNEIVK